MRLTRLMKDNLFTIIKNKTTSPLEPIIDSLIGEIQEAIYKSEPVFKQFIDKYGISAYMREKVYVHGIQHAKEYHAINLFLPKTSLIAKFNKENHATNIIRFDNLSDFAKEPLIKLMEAIDNNVEYQKTLDNLETTIDSCSTDKQLADMYPDFIKYFNAAGIVVQAQKQLPAKLGLPESLVKFGLVLETKEEKESKQKALEEVIKEDIEDDK